MMPVNANAATLILCPTQLELDHLGEFDEGSLRVALCGFGPIVSAARTAALIAELRPSRVVLVGIAGTYDPSRVAPGTAEEFDLVACDGVGVGEGKEFLSPRAVGFPQWNGIVASRSEAIYDTLELSTVRSASTSPRVLLTACAASADAGQAAQRREKFPEAIAEDMEGFAVAAACALANVPLRIIRGISNVVGDRAVATWCISEALSAVRTRLDSLLATDTGRRNA